MRSTQACLPVSRIYIEDQVEVESGNREGELISLTSDSPKRVRVKLRVYRLTLLPVHLPEPLRYSRSLRLGRIDSPRIYSPRIYSPPLDEQEEVDGQETEHSLVKC